jgi:hypothetical protein
VSGNVDVSLFASSIRPVLYSSFLKNLFNERICIEVVFCGYIPIEEICHFLYVSPEISCDIDNDINNAKFQLCNGKIKLIYIETKKEIKPAQCYEIARRACSGRYVIWTADDCEFNGCILTKAVSFYQGVSDKVVLSLQTKESGYGSRHLAYQDMRGHRLFPTDLSSPIMAPIGMINRDYLNILGGLDRRYTCGQYENDIVMRVLSDGGRVEIFGDHDSNVEIDHLGKSFFCKESSNERGFLNRSFALGYQEDRRVLEGSWKKYNKRSDDFIGYPEKGLLTHSY